MAALHAGGKRRTRADLEISPNLWAGVGLVRGVAGTALVAKGLVEASNVEPMIGARLTIGSVIWLVADKRGR